ncbi:MAG TPA: hypothetical protein VK447_00315, partial [Myxococcaceae bacterium]|nr:hypothetical protein [Myxococcaceae bacterium]
ERHAGDWMPIRALGGERGVRYSRAAVKKQFLQRAPSSREWLLTLFKEEGRPKLNLGFIFDGDVTGEFRFRFHMMVSPLDVFREEPQARERGQRLASFILEMARRFPPYYACAHPFVDSTFGTEERGKPLSMRINEVYWLNVFGNELVDTMGRERVLSTPAVQLEELPDGGVFLLIRPTPADYDSDAARVAQAKALVHLHPEHSFDTVLTQLREQSAALVPVKREWDPDLTLVMEETFRRVLPKDDQLVIARYNAYRPPPVSEWMPLDQAPECDVEELEAADEVIGAHAEGVVAAWFHEIPGVGSYKPDTLPLIDKELWVMVKSYVFEDVSHKARWLPALGAYLGNVLTHLGGRWVVRKAVEESYVVVGERAWLPFLRAQHCIGGTEQSVMDYSLTKFYRAAEQHLREFQAKG